MSPIFKKKDPKEKTADAQAAPATETPAEDRDWLIPEDGRKHLLELFKGLKNEVHLAVFTKAGENDPYNEYCLKFARDLARLSPAIKTLEYGLDSPEAKQYGVDSSPTLCLNPEQYSIRYRGAPLGEEGRSFIETILYVSLGVSGLSPVSKQLLGELTEKRHIRVFVTPTCPYCPGQVANAFKCAIERPDLISAECVETGENQALSERFGVGSVPHTVFNDTHNALGLMPEERFVAELVTLKDAEGAYDDQAGLGLEVEKVDVVIIGAGPGGLTAGIYAQRSGLSTVILEKGALGGQVALTPVVENYPGFANVAGQKLMEIMAEHARQYTRISEGEEVFEIKVGKNIEVYTNRMVYVAKAVILATGATWKKLGAPGEDAYFGKGVSYCSTCDGYMYKGKKAVVVGGGATALTDALHLKNLGVDVTLIHRRDAFRAEKHLRDSVLGQGIPVLWDSMVQEILGKDNKVTGIRVQNLKDQTSQEIAASAVFVAVGIKPNNQLASDLGLALDEGGFIKVDAGMRTSIPRVYAIGDVTGGALQIVTAVGMGAVAALSAFEDIGHPYWKKG